ncbi:MAG TPA: type II secretion system protein GspN [Kofleriaceae bacterium]|jgi:type II secretion system protein N
MALPVLSGRVRTIVKYFGYVLVALVAFVFALQATFPYDRLKDKLVEAMSSKYDVTIGSVDRGIMPGSVTFTAVGLRTRPTKPDQVPTVLLINKLHVDLGLLALLGGTASVGFTAQIGPGVIDGKFKVGNAFGVPSKYVVEVEATNLPSGALPMKDLVMLPMSGKISFSADLELPIEKGKEKTSKPVLNFQKASGTIAFECPSNCELGDGVAKLQPILKNARQQAFTGDGIPFGPIRIGSLDLRVKLEKGQLEITKWDLKSPDVEAHFDFKLDLAPTLDESQVNGCIRFKASPELLKRSDKTYNVLTTTGANLEPSDKLFHILLDGKMKDMKRRAIACGPNGRLDTAGDKHDGDSDKHEKPSITIQQPDETLTAHAPDASVPIPGPVNEHGNDMVKMAPNNGTMTGSAGSGSSINAPTPALPPSTTATPPPAPVPDGTPPEGTAGAGVEHQDQQQPQQPIVQ